MLLREGWVTVAMAAESALAQVVLGFRRMDTILRQTLVDVIVLCVSDVVANNGTGR